MGVSSDVNDIMNALLIIQEAR